MVTNINLSSPESERKITLTGKSTLIVSVFLLVAAIVAYGILTFLKDKYTKEKEQISTEIEQKKEDLRVSSYVDLADFQDRINLLDGVITNRFSWSMFIKDFSMHVLPEVKLSSFSPEGSKLPIKGLAPNYETVFREMNLLKKFSGAELVELKSISEVEIIEGDQSQSGISFNVDMTINKKYLVENNSSN